MAGRQAKVEMCAMRLIAWRQTARVNVRALRGMVPCYGGLEACQLRSSLAALLR